MCWMNKLKDLMYNINILANNSIFRNDEIDHSDFFHGEGEGHEMSEYVR